MPEPAQKPLPFHYQLFAGGAAGISEILVMYPLDVIKTRNQLTSGASSGILGSLSAIVRNEGFSRLYRGIAPPIMMEAPKRALKFSTNEQYTQMLKQSVPQSVQQSHKWAVPVLSGMLAGTTEAFLVVPFELVKIRLQDPQAATKYKSTMDCVMKIVRDEGVLTFGKGLESTIWRHASWSGVYFGVIGSLKSMESMKRMRLNKDGQTDKARSMGVDFLAGLVGGTLATTCNTPFDVVKTRIQNNIAPYRSMWTLPALVVVAKNEGVRALWKGYTAKVLRLGPGGGLMLVMFQTVSEWLRQFQQ